MDSICAAFPARLDDDDREAREVGVSHWDQSASETRADGLIRRDQPLQVASLDVECEMGKPRERNGRLLEKGGEGLQERSRASGARLERPM